MKDYCLLWNSSGAVRNVVENKENRSSTICRRLNLKTAAANYFEIFLGTVQRVMLMVTRQLQQVGLKMR